LCTEQTSTGCRVTRAFAAPGAAGDFAPRTYRDAVLRRQFLPYRVGVAAMVAEPLAMTSSVLGGGQFLMSSCVVRPTQADADQ